MFLLFFFFLYWHRTYTCQVDTYDSTFSLLALPSWHFRTMGHKVYTKCQTDVLEHLLMWLLVVSLVDIE